MYSFNTKFAFLLAQVVASSPVGQLQERACPGIHVFGARETTASPGYGSAGTVVNLILNSHSGSTSESITYPACGGQSSCGSVSYANSVVQGINAVVSQVNSFHAQCPSTQLVLVGYSQVSELLCVSASLQHRKLCLRERV
jgi:acetylxylan esterase